MPNGERYTSLSARGCHFSVFDTHLATQRLQQSNGIGVSVLFLILKLTGKNSGQTGTFLLCLLLLQFIMYAWGQQ